MLEADGDEADADANDLPENADRDWRTGCGGGRRAARAIRPAATALGDVESASKRFDP